MTELVAARIERDVVRVHGPDTWSFLQGQLSQDMDALAQGDSAWSFLLQPDGKVAAWLRVTRRADDEALLDVDGGHGQAVVDRLERFKLRIDCTVEPLVWQAVAVRGSGAAGVDGSTVVADPAWPGTEGVDLLGAEVALPEGAREIDVATYERLRIEAGVPAMGHELTEGLIPAESGVVARSVSFTKGCFTGQELVARIESRGGNVPRHLRRLVVADGADPPLGAELLVDGDPVGVLTSFARAAHEAAPIGLAYVKRSVEPPTEGELVWDGGRAAVSVASLPSV